MTIVAISSEEDFDKYSKEWLASLPRYLKKIIVKTVHKGETKKIADNGEITFFQYGYEDFRFDEARNHALSLVETEWALMLDMDERVQIFEKDVDYVSSQPKDIGGMMCTINNFTENGISSFGGLRLMRKEAKFKYRCHEDITPWIKENGFKRANSPLCIRHLGYGDSEVRKDHLVRNYNLILKDLSEDPYNEKLMGDMLDTLKGISNAN